MGGHMGGQAFLTFFLARISRITLFLYLCFLVRIFRFFESILLRDGVEDCEMTYSFKSFTIRFMPFSINDMKG